MKWLNGCTIRPGIVRWIAVIILSGGQTKADFTFGTPENLGPQINSGFCEDGLTISSDGLSIILGSDRYQIDDWDLYMATRQSIEDPWSPAAKLGPAVNGPYSQSYPCLFADGQELFLSSPFWLANWTEFGGADLWVSKRSSISDAWDVPENLGSLVNSSSHDTEPSLSSDGLELYFSSTRRGGYTKGNIWEWNIWVTTRTTKDDPWQEPVNLGPTVNRGNAYTSHISANGLVLLFASTRSGGYGQGDIWMTRRKTKNHPWEEPVNLGFPISDEGRQWAPCLSHDGTMVYFMDWDKRPHYGYFDLWQASIIPIVDLNSDGTVNVKDIAILMDHWGESFFLCDIGPTPLGDGIVDVQDLLILTQYMEPEEREPALVAHWKLDEKSGETARNSVSGDDNVVMGKPFWQPAGGVVNGALEFDGIDDYVSTQFALNPADVSFSALAWIKGGTPGQIILSQADTFRDTPVGPLTDPGTTWLGTDSSDGGLMTGLMDSFFGPLESESVITDDQWHHVGLVYDLSAMHRHLYVDGIQVAVDAGLVGGLHTTGGLYIGAGHDLGPGTFFSGLIDDVRIYRTAISDTEIAVMAQ